MRDNMLKYRARQILLRICKETNYVTISAIAKDLGISAKTVLRELAGLEQWLERKGCSLSKKTGVGIKVNGSEDRINIVLDILQNETEESLYTPKERQIVIISELLGDQEPVKLYNFTKLLRVTEGTISNDLDKVEQWFAGQKLTLIRKPGLGVYVEGPEQNIRKAMVHFIYENIDENQLLGVIRASLMKSPYPSSAIEIKTRRRLLNLISRDVICKLEVLLHQMEARIGYKLADNAYVGLIVHLALAIQRIKKNEKIAIDSDFLAELKKYPEFSIAFDMAESIAKDFDIEIPEAEIGYITMHIKGSKNRKDGSNKASPIGNFTLVKLAKDIIKIAEVETGSFLAHNEQLLIGLVNHLGPSLSRIKMNLEIRNPLLDEIKACYPELLVVSRKCAEAVKKQLGITMPESEIAYIAMHLGAALEKGEKYVKPRYRCAIACSTGIGTSSLLATKVEKEFDNLQVVDVISTLHLEDKRLKERQVDFIISTVSIENSPIPVVTVNPLLLDEDKIKINKQTEKLFVKDSCRPAPQAGGLQFRDKLLMVNDYNKAVLEVLDNLFVLEDTPANITAIINTVSYRLAGTNGLADKIACALKDRERRGSTVMTGHNSILLHCRTDAVAKLYFGAVQVKSPLFVINGKGQKEQVKLAAIMLAPENCGKCAMETMSYISKMLIDKPAFISKLKAGTREAVFVELSSILEDFYNMKHKVLMEV